jgi:amidase
MVTFVSGPFVFRKEPIHRGLASAARLKFKRYMLALARRDEFISQIENFLDSYDAWLCPVSSRPAFKHRSPVILNRPGEPIDVDGHDVPYWIGTVAYTSIFSLTGAPVVVLPLTQSREGLPIGVQLAGRRWSDVQLLDTAGKLLQMTAGYQRPPGY